MSIALAGDANNALLTRSIANAVIEYTRSNIHMYTKGMNVQYPSMLIDNPYPCSKNPRRRCYAIPPKSSTVKSYAALVAFAGVSPSSVPKTVSQKRLVTPKPSSKFA